MARSIRGVGTWQAGVLFVLLAMAGLWGWRALRLRSTAVQRGRVQDLLVDQRYAEADALATRLVAQGDAPAQLWMTAAEAAAGLKDFPRAVVNFEHALQAAGRLPAADRQRTEHEAHARAGEILLLSLHRPTAAEAHLREAVALNPAEPSARRQLTGLLGLTGRTDEATAQRMELVRLRKFTMVDLILLGLRDTALENLEFLQDFIKDAPDDPLTLLAQAHVAIRKHRPADAEPLLKRVVQARPDLTVARILWGRALLELQREAEFSAWRRAVPDTAKDHADYWTLMGDAARAAGEPRMAIRCYAEAVRRDSLQQQACYQLGQLLRELERTGAESKGHAAPLLDRARLLQEWLLAVKAYHAGSDLHLLQGIVTRCEQLGLLWEAHAWALAARQALPQAASGWAQTTIQQLEPRLQPGSPRQVVDSQQPTLANPALGFDASRFPLPAVEATSEEAPSKTTAQPSTISFRDDARARGIVMDYATGHDPAFGGRRVFEFAGGGVGVVDYDLDGLPDLYLTQGGTWPPKAGQTEFLDRLYRQSADGHFQEIAQAAGVVEDRYSQGVAVGDWNDDGFPDLFVANVGANRLYVNHGDGSFADVTEATGVGGSRWTSSCVIADLNGDAFPDLLAVNYLEGDDLYNRLCHNSTGQTRTCTPHDLNASPDEFYLNLGDGRFAEQTRESGFETASGKSLGVVVADFEQTGRLSVFVSNDTDGNQYFQNQTPVAQSSVGLAPRFEEQGVLRGLAFDREGRSLAGMGIAAGDANGDRRLDLFVTNYYEESNTLYLQSAGGQFQDQTQAAGLRTASLPMLGFGAQFLDADLDGMEDLVVVNGHVDDERKRGIPYQMQPQFFRNLGNVRFAELPPAELGPWFQRPTLGRGLARLDWNRDGRMDFAVAHHEHPFGLLTNTTVVQNETLVVVLRGVQSCRDAIGAVVEVQTADRTIARQLVAGDGYQVSNERILQFGLKKNSENLAIRVTWPSGFVQKHESWSSRGRVLLVEGASRPVELP